MNEILCGDALCELKKMPSDSVDCVITSPPYWNLRDYGIQGQLGLEPTPEGYLQNMMAVFDEVKRVLKPSGSCWVNLGDSFTDKTLSLIPQRFAVMMQEHGWLVRNQIIWAKPNCMPSSVKDRFTSKHEVVYLFTKSRRYFFDLDSVRVPSLTEASAKFNIRVRRPALGRIKEKWGTLAKATEKEAENYNEKEYSTQDTHPNRQVRGFNERWKTKQGQGVPGQTWQSFNHEGRSGYFNADGTPICDPRGKNPGDVWSITTKPHAFAHFAVFPEDLIEPMVSAGCPQKVCVKCGAPTIKTFEKNGEPVYSEEGNPQGRDRSEMRWNDSHPSENPRWFSDFRQTGEQDGCECNAEKQSGVVMDIFMGSGTVAVVAEKLGRRWLGIELNPKYIEIAETRLAPWRAQSRLEDGRA